MVPHCTSPPTYTTTTTSHRRAHASVQQDAQAASLRPPSPSVMRFGTCVSIYLAWGLAGGNAMQRPNPKGGNEHGPMLPE